MSKATRRLTSNAQPPPKTNAQALSAIDYIERGFAPIPVEPGGKAGIGRWDKLRITKETAARHFTAKHNIGLLLGEPSGGLTDIDLDCLEAIAAAPTFLPATNMISGRASKPASHWFYISTLHASETSASIQYKDTDGSVLCELRCAGGGSAAQSVVPRSVHKTGEQVEWYKDGLPTDVENDELKRAVAKCAAASLLARHWPIEGGRHHAALALDGFLTRAAWSTEDRRHFIEAVATIAGDDDPRDRKRTSDRTEQKLKKGGKVSGFPKMVELFGEDVVKRLAHWIEYPGSDIKEPLERMNAEYAVVMDGGKTRILRFDPQVQTRGDGRVVHRRLVPDFLSFGDFYNYHLDEHVWTADQSGNEKAVSLGVWWAKHPQRRTYRGVTFQPNANEVVDGRLNLWRGWGVVPAAGDWSLLERHIEQILAAGDEQVAIYIENWLAWAVQNPADRAQVAMVFKGGRGTGKGTLGNAMCHLFGQHATHFFSRTCFGSFQRSPA